MLQENSYRRLGKNYRKGKAKMKKIINNCFATTGLSLILLAIVATLYDATFLCIATVYQAFAANLVIHLGLVLLRRFESKYVMVELLVEISYELVILIIAGFLFEWYSSTPIWVLILLVIAVYFIGILTDVFRIKTDVEFINSQLKLRKKEAKGM